MHCRIASAAAGAALLLAAFGHASAGPPCPDSSTVVTTFGCTFSGSYRPGQPYDVLTIWPRFTGSGPYGPNERLSDAGIEIHVLVRDCQGTPLASNVELRNDSLCIVQGSNTFGTGESGRGSFSGGILGKGFCSSLDVFADGVRIGTAPIRINGPGPEEQGSPDPDCCHDAFSLARYASHAGESGVSSAYSIESDFNEDGFVDLVDWLIWHGHQRGMCLLSSAEVRP